MKRQRLLVSDFHGFCSYRAIDQLDIRHRGIVTGAQAALQCLAGPSGWHLLGRTPVRTFHPQRDPVFLIEPGDTVTFERIDAAAFDRLERLAERGETVAELIS